MHPSTFISLCTVRLLCTSVQGVTSCGTGFFYLFSVPNDPNIFIPTIITNKHVINGAQTLQIEVQAVPIGTKLQNDGTVANETRFPATFTNIQNLAVQHPDQAVDLCAIPIAQMMNDLKQRGLELKNSFLTRDVHLPEQQHSFVRPIEQIIMIGYPNGLWDQHNNRPVARQGLTASHPLLNWNGRREFMIDAACFGGSSGSPVFLYENGMIRSGDNGFSPGTRALLLGVLWGGPLLNAEGRLEVREVPTALQPVPVTPQMMNLGFVIHASAIDDLHPLLLPHI